MWDYRARVVDVHDGDTLTVELDLGFRLAAKVDVRLQDVYAPELRQHGGTETKAYVQGWVDTMERNYYGHDWPFIVRTLRKKDDSEEVTTFDRYVAVVTDLGGTDCLNVAVEDYVKANKFPGGTGSAGKGKHSA